MKLSTPIQIRWSDLDLQGHVNNVRTLALLEQARRILLEPLVGGHVVYTHQVEYRQPLMHLGEPLKATCHICAIEDNSFACVVQLWQTDKVAVAAQTYCHLDDGDHPDWQNKLKPFCGDPLILHKLNSSNLSDGSTHHILVNVRFDDVGPKSEVHPYLYFDYVQEARVMHVSSVDPTASAGKGNHVWFLARQDIEYLKPMVLREHPYQVTSQMLHFGNSSMTSSATITDPQTGDINAQLISVLVCADLEGNPIPIPQELKTYLGGVIRADR